MLQGYNYSSSNQTSYKTPFQDTPYHLYFLPKAVKTERGVHPPFEAILHFPPCFRFPPYFRQIFRLCGKFPKCYLFSKKISDDLLLVMDHKFRISPYFSCFSTFPPVSGKLVFPYFHKSPPCFRKIHLLFTYFLCISFLPLL